MIDLQEYEELTHGRISQDLVTPKDTQESPGPVRRQGAAADCTQQHAAFDPLVMAQLRAALSALQPAVHSELQRVHLLLSAQTQTEHSQGLPTAAAPNCSPLSMAVGATGLVPRNAHPSTAASALAAQPAAAPAVLTHLEAYTYHVKSSRAAISQASQQVTSLARTVHLAASLAQVASKQQVTADTDRSAHTDDSSGSASSADSLPLMEGLSQLHRAVQHVLQSTGGGMSG